MLPDTDEVTHAHQSLHQHFEFLFGFGMKLIEMCPSIQTPNNPPGPFDISEYFSAHHGSQMGKLVEKMIINFQIFLLPRGANDEDPCHRFEVLRFNELNEVICELPSGLVYKYVHRLALRVTWLN